VPAIIGVTSGDPFRERSAEGVPNRPHAALKQDYLDAVAGASAIPIVIAPEATAATDLIVSRIDGLMLVGGVDVHPANYGESVLNATVNPGPERDELELALLQSAFKRDLPVLAICRGHQILNVARGGTLWQDLPTQLPDGLRHSQRGDPHSPGHELRVAAGSLLRRIAGSEHLEANSFHHQAVRELGRGLQPTAWSSDGLVEAVEDSAHRFMLGVQWHPEEMLDSAPHRALFASFVEAAEERACPESG
jgi:putative glutamine amidotransferase